MTESLSNDYSRIFAHDGVGTPIPISNFTDFSLDTRLALFKQEPSPDAYPRIVGLGSEEFATMCESIGKPKGFGAVSHFESEDNGQTFELKVFYDKDFFATTLASDGESFEDILPTAVEYEFRKIFHTLEIKWSDKNETPMLKDFYSTIIESMQQAPDYKLDKFIEYLGLKTRAEYEDEHEVSSMLQLYEMACGEYLYHEGLSDEDIEYVLRNLGRNI